MAGPAISACTAVPQLRVRPPDPRGFEYTTAKPAEVSTWVSSNQEWVYWEKGPPWMLTMTGNGPCPRGFASHPVMVPPSPGTLSTSGTTEFAGAGCSEERRAGTEGR